MMYKKIVFSLLLISMSYLSANSSDEAFIKKGQVLSSSFFTLLNSPDSNERIIRNIYLAKFQDPINKWLANGNFSFTQSKLSNANIAKVSSYTSHANDSIISPLITLPLINQLKEKIILNYTESYELESSYDFGRVYISTDGGNWKLQHSVTGRNNKNMTRIDISKFAGKTIRLKYELTSDDSYEYSGWDISKVSIDVTERYSNKIDMVDKQSSRSITTRLTSSEPLSAAFLSLNSQKFPYIYNTINVSDSTLSQNNFTIFENGVRQLNSIKVIPPESGGNSKLVDIIFVMDNSGSMSPHQLAVENHVIDFVDALNASGIDYALGLCRYGQSSNYGAPFVEDSGVLTTSGTYFKNTVWQRNIVSGGDEPAFDAIAYSMSHFAFRPGSQKVVILITDERPNQGSITDLQAISALNSQSASLNVLTEKSLYSYYDNFSLSSKSGIIMNGTLIAPNSTTSSSLSAGAKNYYRIDITQPGTLLVSTTSSIDTYGYLYNENGNQLLSNDDSGSGNNFLLSHFVVPGTYYVEVKGRYSSTSGTYTLTSSLSVASVTQIAPNSSTVASLNAGEKDVYKIELTQPGTLLVSTTSSIDTYGYLYDENGNQLLSNDDSGSGSNFRLSKTVSAGIYYIVAKGYSSSTAGSYTLISNFTATAIGESVPGALYPITDPFDGILNDISAQLSSSYLLRYRTSNPSLNGQLRTVSIRVNSNGGQVEVSKSYTPASAPIITRPSSTIAYESKAWAENVELSIDISVTDGLEPYTSGVTLYYKNIGSSNYIGVNMTNSQNTIWTANIPANIVLTPGVAYYISATDGISTVTLPSSNAQTHPFVISVLPNKAPIVRNVSETMLSNEEMSISASITDTTNYLEEVSVYYREKGDLVYTKVSMTLKTANNYEAIISTLEMQEGVEYYIYAKDDFGVVTTHGTPDKPIYMRSRVCLVPIITFILSE